MTDSSGLRSRKVGILLMLAAALSLSACTSNAYMGIPLVETTADPTLRMLATRASAGDKEAQLDLGIRFEEGRGLRRDLAKAKQLYRLAGSDSGGIQWVYSPPVPNGAKGRVVPIDKGIMQPGLIEARRRLDALTCQAPDLKAPQ